MLEAMDIPAAADLWLAVGLLLAVLLLAGAGRVAAQRRRRGTPTTSAIPRPEDRRDDLAGFSEHPPGTAGAPRVGGGGWATLSAPPPAPPAPEPAGAAGPRRLGSRAVLTATALAALGLLAAATAAALVLPDRGSERDAGRDRPGRSAEEDRPADDRLAEARLSFDGVVLEPHAVGITATYPELRVTDDGKGLRAQLVLPTWNCLAGEAPADPEAAGCRRTVPEVADLSTPDLEVAGTSRSVRISGRFATSTRPNGSSPSSTGRTYDVVVTVAAGDRAKDGWLPADGVLELGGDQAETTGTDVAAGRNVLRYRER
jgi:hypothetical protein